MLTRKLALLYGAGEPLPEIRPDEQCEQDEAGDWSECKERKPAQLLRGGDRQRDTDHEFGHASRDPNDPHPLSWFDDDANRHNCPPKHRDPMQPFYQREYWRPNGDHTARAGNPVHPAENVGYASQQSQQGLAPGNFPDRSQEQEIEQHIGPKEWEVDGRQTGSHVGNIDKPTAQQR